MSFINRNANLILLILIVVSAIALTGATVFFQKNFEKVNTEYNSKLEQLNEVSNQLKQYKQILDQTKDEISLLRLRDEDFTDKFTEIKDEKEDLEAYKSKIERENTELRLDLTGTIEKYNTAKLELDEAKKTLAEIAQERANLRAEVKSLKAKIRDLENQLGIG